MTLHFLARRFSTLPLALVLAAFSSSAQTNAPQAEPIEGFKDTGLLPGGKWHQHDPDRPQPPVVTPGATFSQGAPPPSDAEILFDGTDLAKWEKNEAGDAAHWQVRDGYVQVTRGGDIRTRGRWSDFQLHVEWMAPTATTDARGQTLHGQSRGNSGILINDMYEVQILDSYHDKTYPDGQAGAIYGQMPPFVNASKPPGEWQTYDIIWESPRWNEKDDLTQKACATVLHNGVVIQHRTEFLGSTDGIGSVKWRTPSFYQKHDPAVFVELQTHNDNPVRFRNIWIRNLNVAERQ